MAFNSNGQISYLVLDSLSSGSKYGLEIIEYISKKTGGNYVMKKPTLYSCLTRMEKKGLVSSSYWGESELGGKRHYYSITSSGKASLEELSNLFANTNFENVEEVSSESETQTFTPDQEEKPTILHQGNIFDLVKEEKLEKKPQPEQKNDVVENQIDIFNMEPIQEPVKNDAVLLDESERISVDDVDKISYYQNKLEQNSSLQELQVEEEKQEPTFDDGKFLDDHDRLTPDQEEQNKRLYDTSSELKKYRKKKSFSENQIEMAVVYEDEEYDQIQKERIAELKRSLLGIKENGTAKISQSETEDGVEVEKQTDITPIFNQFENTPTHIPSRDDGILFEREYVEPQPIRQKVEKTDEDEPINDAIFITEPRMEEIPIQRKITPPNIEVSIYDDNLPAPKRDSELEPTYRDMMAKLFEKKKEKEISRKAPTSQMAQPTVERFDNTNFNDYGTLKRYYNSQGIAFKEYKKTTVERKHNTNLLNLISSAILLLLSGVGSAILYGIISGTHNLKAGTNFMFYTLPILFAVLTVVDFCIFRILESKKSKLFYNAIVNWCVFMLGVIIVCVVNICCGMQAETIAKFSTSLFVPILGLLLLLPINYYIRKYLYKRYGK